MATRELNVLAFMKDEGERFIFYYDDEPESQIALLQTLGRMAADPDLSLTWYDAALLSKKVRNDQCAGSCN